MLHHIDGFDQFQGLTGTPLMSALAAAAYQVTQGMGMASGRHSGTYALELHESPGLAGESWSKRTNTVKSSLYGVATDGNGLWIAVGDDGTATKSTDTLSWTPVVLGISTALKDIIHVNGRWIIIGANGTILVSDDGAASWSTRTSPIAGAVLNSIAANGSTVVIVGSNGATGMILLSTDKGDTWGTISTNPGNQPNLKVAYGGGTWVVGGNGGQIRTSPDATTWTTAALGVATPVTGLAFGDGVWMAPSGRTVRISNNNGATWGEVANTLGTSSGSNFTIIEYSAGRWIIAGGRGELMTSENRTDWFTRPLTGTTTSTQVADIAVSSGARSGLVTVGNLIGSGATATAMIYASLAPPTVLTHTLTSTASKVVIGFAHKATSRGRIMSIANLFELEWPGGLTILGQNSTAIPIRNAWYFYELVIDKTAKTVSLFVNDTADIVVPLPATVATMDTFVISWLAENGAVALLDDVYLLDNDTANGATLVDRLRPIRIPLRLPTADSDVNWEGSAPGNHAPLVGVLPASDSSYVRSAESGAQELFTSTTALPASATEILAVGVLALAKKSDLDNRQLGLAVGPAGPTQVEVIDTTLSVTPEYSLGIFEKAPGGSNWTVVSVLSTPFGVIVRP